MTGETELRVHALQAAEHTCPKCGHRGFCDVSPHPWFELDRIAIRCAQCRHVWPDRPIEWPPLSSRRVP